MREKARENLKAANLLPEKGLVNAATSRFYYALFQATAYALERQGLKPADLRGGAKGWEHRSLANEAHRARGLLQDRVLLEDMRLLREKADYAPDAVERRYVELRKHEMARFVDEVTT